MCSEVAGHDPIGTRARRRPRLPAKLRREHRIRRLPRPRLHARPAPTAGMAARPVTCDLYDWWTIPHRTAGRLPRAGGEASQGGPRGQSRRRGGKPFGRADVTYRRRTTPRAATVLATAGALRLPPAGAAADPADAPPSADIARRGQPRSHCASSPRTAAEWSRHRDTTRRSPMRMPPASARERLDRSAAQRSAAARRRRDRSLERD